MNWINSENFTELGYITCILVALGLTMTYRINIFISATIAAILSVFIYLGGGVLKIQEEKDLIYEQNINAGGARAFAAQNLQSCVNSGTRFTPMPIIKCQELVIELAEKQNNSKFLDDVNVTLSQIVSKQQELDGK